MPSTPAPSEKPWLARAHPVIPDQVVRLRGGVAGTRAILVGADRRRLPRVREHDARQLPSAEQPRDRARCLARVFHAGTRQPLFKVVVTGADLRYHYDVAPGGDRFLVNTLLDGGTTPLTVVTRWNQSIR